MLFIVLILGAIGIVVIILTSQTGRTQVFTSFIAVGALVLFWPLVHRGLRRDGHVTTTTPMSMSMSTATAPE